MKAPKVKICGVTQPRDAEMAVDLGAAFLGLNFYPGSPRCVTVDQGREIAAAVAGRVRLVGVFVNADPREVAAIADEVGLELLQFSGDEGPEVVLPVAGRAIKVFRTGGDPGPAALAPYPGLWGLLVDTRHGALYGGTGIAWDYGSVAELVDREPAQRVFLAGGLKPDNVARAVAASRPYAIDVCSGVESAPGIKDRSLIERLFAEVWHGQSSSPA